MLTFRQREDIPKARLPTHLAEYIDQIFNGILRGNPGYQPEHDGHVVCVTPRDNDDKISKMLGSRYRDDVWEGISLIAKYRCYHGVFICGNQFTVSVIVPTDQGVDTAIIARMERESA